MIEAMCGLTVTNYNIVPDTYAGLRVQQCCVAVYLTEQDSLLAFRSQKILSGSGEWSGKLRYSARWMTRLLLFRSSTGYSSFNMPSFYFITDVAIHKIIAYFCNLYQWY